MRLEAASAQAEVEAAHRYGGRVNLAAETAPRTEMSLVRSAAALSLGAALIHASVIAIHFREYWLFGLLFAITAVGQFVWAGIVWTRPASPRLLVSGAVANLAVAVVWLVSRTAGLPIGPDAGDHEAVGVHDVLATTDELALAGIVAWALLAPARTEAAGGALAVAWSLAAASGIAALVGGHG